MSQGCPICLHDDLDLVEQIMKQLTSNELDIHKAADLLNIEVHNIEDHLNNRHSLDAIIQYRRHRIHQSESSQSLDTEDLSVLTLTGDKDDYKRIINNLLIRMNLFLVDIETKPLTRSQDIRAATALTREMRGCVKDLPEIERMVAETRHTEIQNMKAQFEAIQQWMTSRDGLCSGCRQKYIELTSKMEEELPMLAEGEVIIDVD